MKYLLYCLLILPLICQSQIEEFNYFIDNVSLAPNYEGDTFQIHVREKIATEVLNNPDHDYQNKVVIMVHGNSVPATAVFDLNYQDYSWMDALAAQGYDVFAMSMTGYGFSSRPEPMQDSCNVDLFDRLEFGISCFANYPFRMTTTDSEMDDLDAVVDFVRDLRAVDEVALIGHSLGGFRVLLYSHRYPEKVNKLITHGFSGVSSIFSQADPPDNLPSAGYPMKVYNRTTIDDIFAEAECEDQYDPLITDPVWNAIQATDTIAISWGDSGGLVRYPQFDLYGLTNDTIEDISIPTLVLIGEVDNIAPPIAASAYYDRLASSEKVYVQINRTSHIGYWESRKNTIHDLCLQWLDDTSIDGRSIGKAIYKLDDSFEWGEDMEAPMVMSTFPTHEAIQVPLESDLSIKLNEAVFNLAEHLTIFRKADNSVFDYIELGDTNRVKQHCSNIIDIELPELEDNTVYYVYLHFDAFRDEELNYFPGILDDKTWVFSTGDFITNTEEVQASISWSISPNPTRDIIQLNLADQVSQVELSLYNLQGQIIKQLSIYPSDPLSVSDLAPGIYLAAIRSRHQVSTKKLIIQ